MIWCAFWTAAAIAIFLWNYFDGQPFLGVRFTERFLGHPLNAGWLAAAVAVYCLIRWIVRRRRRPEPKRG